MHEHTKNNAQSKGAGVESRVVSAKRTDTESQHRVPSLPCSVLNVPVESGTHKQCRKSEVARLSKQQTVGPRSPTHTYPRIGLAPRRLFRTNLLFKRHHAVLDASLVVVKASKSGVGHLFVAINRPPLREQMILVLRTQARCCQLLINIDQLLVKLSSQRLLLLDAPIHPCQLVANACEAIAKHTQPTAA